MTTQAALKQEPSKSNPACGAMRKGAVEIVRDTHTAEMVIALCGPIGSPLHEVAQAVKQCLVNDFGYECMLIKLSDFIEEHSGKVSRGVSRYQRIKELIKKGNELRSRYSNGVLAELAISKISYERNARQRPDDKRYYSRRICHIIDSIKNQEELDVLRLVYRDMLFCIGVLSPLESREKSLKKDMVSKEVWDLIDQDSGEEIGHGQTVRDTFPQSDIFLRADTESETEIGAKITRFLNIILCNGVITPTPDETAMYMAASAALNSACLSRQVGASVTDRDGNVISVGWNDVPKFGGNVYQSWDLGKKGDFRCENWKGGVCHNTVEKKMLAASIVEELVKAEVVTEEHRATFEKVIARSKIRDLIEFSRSIHAEMHAILIGSQNTGNRMVGGKLFCTTYPCHSCARHIVASGIKQVYFIEPYRKSLAAKLHGDTITETKDNSERVQVLPFEGVAPNRYMELFRARPDERKDGDGKKVLAKRTEVVQKSGITLEAFPVLEAAVVKALVEKQLIDADYENSEPQSPA